MIDFIGKKKTFFTISIAIILLGLIFNIAFGTKLSISFKGGTMISYGYNGVASTDDIKKAVDKVVDSGVTVTEGESLSGDESAKTVNVALAVDADDKLRDEITAAMEEIEEISDVEVLSYNSVPARTGKALFQKGFATIAIAVVLMLVYVAFRFRKIGGFSAGLSAVVALVHDVILAYLAFVVFRIELDDNFIAVILTIIGYSLNDTIVIFDRIRENRRIFGEKKSISEIANISMNQCLTRTINTSITTFAAILVVAIVGQVANIATIQSFAIPMCVGVVVGCYSSLFIAIPLWVTWRNHFDAKAAEKAADVDGVYKAKAKAKAAKKKAKEKAKAKAAADKAKAKRLKAKEKAKAKSEK